MRIGRTIFAVLIGLSVALLPATSGFAAGAATPTLISAAASMPDCDHAHRTPDTQTGKTANGGACMANCALFCFSVTAFGYSGIAFSPPEGGVLKPVAVIDAVSPRVGDAPFRPPRA